MNKEKDRKIICARYILPPLLLLGVLVFSFIPSYRYSVNGAENEVISGAEIFWTQLTTARETLFIKNESDARNINFAKYILSVQGVGISLWLIGFASSVYAAISAIVSFFDVDEERADRWRMIFSVIFPSRAMLTVMQMLCIALPLFPYILPSIYHASFSDTQIGFALCAPDLLIFMGVALAAIVALTAVSANAEQRYDGDLFRKVKSVSEKPEVKAEEVKAESSTPSLGKNEQQAKNEKIRRLFDEEDGTKKK